MIVVYWYFDNADPMTQDLQALLRFILRRVAAYADPFPIPILDLARKHELSNSNPSIKALYQILRNTIVTLEEDIFIVFDAIDEYQADDPVLREEFLEMLSKLCESQLQKLHLLVTSVHENDIQDTFSVLKQPPIEIGVEDAISVDLDAYLEVTIAKHAKTKNWSPEILYRIKETLKADGYEQVFANYLCIYR